MHRDGKAVEISDQEKLSRALDTVVQVLVGSKLETVRESVTALDSRLSKRIHSLGEDSTAAIERTVKDLSARIDGLARKVGEAEERQKEASADLDQRSQKTETEMKDQIQRIASKAETDVEQIKSDLDQRSQKTETEMKDQIQRVESKAETGIQQARSEISKDLAAKEEQLRQEMGGLAAALSTLQLELQRQMMNSERISNLIGGMANVFTGQQQAASGPAQEFPEDLAADENLEDVLDQAFHTDMPAAETVESSDSSGGPHKK
jgi:Fe2+ transport system protein B